MCPNEIPVITLCGSSKFKEEFIEANEKLSLAGAAVFSLGLFGHVDKKYESVITPEVKSRLDIVHRKKIYLSDAIFVINKDDYIGYSTNREIDYAMHRGVKIFTLEKSKHFVTVDYGYDAILKWVSECIQGNTPDSDVPTQIPSVITDEIDKEHTLESLLKTKLLTAVFNLDKHNRTSLSKRVVLTQPRYYIGDDFYDSKMIATFEIPNPVAVNSDSDSFIEFLLQDWIAAYSDNSEYAQWRAITVGRSKDKITIYIAPKHAEGLRTKFEFFDYC